jgi:hypothetical protein
MEQLKTLPEAQPVRHLQIQLLDRNRMTHFTNGA